MSAVRFWHLNQWGRCRGAAPPLVLLFLVIIAALGAASFATLKAVDEHQKRLFEQRRIKTLERECDALKEEIARYKMIAQEPEKANQLLREQEETINDLRFELDCLDLCLKGLPTPVPSVRDVFREMWRYGKRGSRFIEARRQARSLREIEHELLLREEISAIDAQLRDLDRDAPQAKMLRARRQAIVTELGRTGAKKRIVRIRHILRRVIRR